VSKTGGGGGKGFADVWRKGFFAWEYKGKHKDLRAAYEQLLLYREDLENPPLLVVTDMDRFEVHTNFTGTVKRIHAFANAELPREENLAVLRALFEDPGSLRPDRTAEGVTEEAARRFAILADGLRSRGHDPHVAARFLNRLLFCLFAEDVGLLPRDLFTRVAERTGSDPGRFARYAGELFGAMASGGDFLLEDIRRFDGGLFADTEALPLEAEELRVLVEAARLDWDSVEPAIFGTLFERSLDPAQRAKLGAHYTSREDILAVVEPVLMAPLRREWEEVRGRAGVEAEKARALSGRSASNALQRAETLLVGFAEKLRGVRVLDPACGSGNFLTVSLKELLDLEKEVSTFAASIGLTPFFPGVSPEQVFGIETSPYAHELAQVAIWIGYLQWMNDNGFGTRQEPILGPMTNIREMDAILARDENGTLHEPEWPEADVIVGNPPFLGGKRMRTELEDGYVDDLFSLYVGRVAREADLVTYWFEKARAEIEQGRAKRAGLLATNSIRGGANRKVLQRIRESGGIFFAESDRPWILNGAAVRVSMVGFDGGDQRDRVLDGLPVEKIYADLTGTLDLTGAERLPENMGMAFMGDTKGGPFDLPPETAHGMLAAGGNPNGRPNSDVVRPWANGLDITRRPRDYYIIDFGTEMGLEDAALYEAPFEHVNQHVKPMREKSNRKAYRDRWWIHMEPRPAMRHALAGLPRYLATARVAKHRLFAWLDEDTLPDSQIIAFALNADYSFGILHSKAHELWSRRMGTWMGVGNDLRYTPTTCFETFPFPEPTDEHREEIASAARRLDQLRRNWLDPGKITEAELKKRTLTNLYNQHPTWLANAHAALDRAVFAAYGWPEEIDDEDILKNLLALNLERSASR
jgi:type II restriction/modification system DNA methylase subunit YeeA